MPGRQRAIRDMIVVLPGITGSVLAEPGGRTGLRDVWAPSGSALWTFLSSTGESLQQLAVPVHDPQLDAPDAGHVATRLVPGFHGAFGLVQIERYGALVS